MDGTVTIKLQKITAARTLQKTGDPSGERFSAVFS